MIKKKSKRKRKFKATVNERELKKKIKQGKQQQA